MIESEAAYFNFLETIPFSTFLLDTNGAIVNTNSITEKTFGYTKDDLISKNLFEMEIFEEFITVVRTSFEALLDGITVEPIEIIAQNKDKDLFWVSFIVSLVRLDESTLVQIICQDITVRKIVENAMRHRLRIEGLISEISSRFMGITDIDNALDSALADIGRISGASRAYFCLLTKDKKKTESVQEWYAEGVSENLNYLQNLSSKSISWWMNRLYDKRIVHIKDVSQLPSEAQNEKDLLELHGIKSLVAFPVYMATELIGYIGFDNIETGKGWKEEDINSLQLFAQIIGSAVERKLAEQELWESEEKYRHITENVDDAISIINRTAELEYVNQSFSTLLGYSGDELIGKSVLSMLEPENMLLVPKLIKDTINSGEVSMEMSLKNKNGALIWIDVRGKSFKGKDGKRRLLTVARDITEQKLLEQSIQSKTTDFIFLIDFETRQILELNPSLQHFLGYSTEEIANLTLYEIEAHNKVNIDQKISQINLEKNSYLGERLYRNKTGDVIDVEVKASLISYKGKKAIHIVSKDITNRKLMERKLKESEKKIAEKNKLAALGQLASGVAHEINTPLATIDVTSEYLEQLAIKQETIDPENIKRELKIIRKQVDICAQIVRNLLQFSRKIEMKSKFFDLDTIINDLLNNPLILKKFREMNVDITSTLDEDTRIFGDPVLLTQVIQNILLNSLDSLEGVPHTPKIELFVSQLDNNVMLRIIDNGRGIKEEDLPRIFEPFYTTKAVGKGTGLGLSISRGIIEKHGGSLVIKSTYGEGTEAIITLPTLKEGQN